jgi:hypothetical protein
VRIRTISDDAPFRPIRALPSPLVTMCALCRRNLLTGERYRHWEPAAGGGIRAVCALCETDARRAGWVRTEAEAGRQGADLSTSTVRLVA